MNNNNQKIIAFAIILFLIGGGIFWHFSKSSKRSIKKISLDSSISKKILRNMKLTSSAFENNQFIPAKYTCDGEDVNPPLNISEVPEEAKSLVLIVDDPDAPMGVWSHWVVWNIDPSVSQIKENETPKGGVEGLNDFKKHSYGGPCPPSGVHHYYFKLYALNKKLDLPVSSEKRDVEKAMEGFVVDKTELIGLYKRK